MKNQKWLRPLRILIGLVFFSGFMIIFSDVRATLPPGMYNFFTSFQFLPSGLKLFTAHTLISIVFIGLVLITLFGGRIYCSVFCPLGIMQDILAHFNFFRLPFKKQRRKFKKALNYIRYPILGAFILTWISLGIVAVSWLDPYANFGRIASSIYQPLFVFLNNGLSDFLSEANSGSLEGIHTVSIWLHPVTLLAASGMFLLILVLVIYQDRLYCNTVCPVGTFLGLLSKVSLFKIRIQNTACTQCGKCQLACKANCINIKEMTIDETRCVSCYNCISSCQDDAVGYRLARVKPAPVEATRASKRAFIKSGLLYLAAVPLIAKADDSYRSDEADEHASEEKQLKYKDRGPISPPGSRGIKELKEHCIGCQLCVSACPTKVLQPAFLEYGFTGMMFPRMDNEVGFCNFECKQCGDVCPTGAILSLTKEAKKKVQIGIAQFMERYCIVKTNGTACGACDEHCPTNAIEMVPSVYGPNIPKVDPEICTGCGACEYACPVEVPHPAIFVAPSKVHGTSKKFVQEQVKWDENVEEDGWAF
ncbi:MAG: 4Fe-4S binding protein [Bacteroidales bacterium]|nr:4Fe-4S binding protein [Bacteroidales bacterium]